MREIRTILVILPTLLFSCAGGDVGKYIPPTPTTPSEPGGGVIYHKRVREQFNLINQYYRTNGGATEGLYSENYPERDGDSSTSFLWPYDGLISGAATLYALGYDVNYMGIVNRFDVYHRTSSGSVNVGGYGSLTNDTTGGGTRYYGDNSVVGIDLVKTCSLTNNQTYLVKAKRIVEFPRSSEDNTFGGGLWWNEDGKNIPGNKNSNRPSCASGYAILSLSDYHSVCPQSGKAEVLAFVKRLYDQVVVNLRDPMDGCHWDGKQVSGSVREAKWTCNTGATISNGVRLYKITGEQTYLDSTIASSGGAYDYFVRPLNGLALAYPDHDPRFTTRSVRAPIDTEPYYRNVGNYIRTFTNFLDCAYENARLLSGLFYEDQVGTDPKWAKQLLIRNAALESLEIIALYEGETVTGE